MVIMMKSPMREKHIEEMFLPHSEICIISPNKKYAFDISDHGACTEALPLCCMLMSGNEIVALDCGILRFNELYKWRYIDTGNGNTVDQLTHHYNELTRQWEEINTKRQIAYSLMAKDHGIAPTIIGKASRNVYVTIPRNTEKVCTDKHGYVTAVVPNAAGSRRDKYWFYKNSKFRSSKEVDLFKELIKEYDGDANKAELHFKDILKKRNEARKNLLPRKRGGSEMYKNNKAKKKRKKNNNMAFRK
jgi:hypothetical protein